MAVFEQYGPWTAESGSGNRMRLWSSATVTNVSESTASVRVVGQLQTRYSATDTSNSFQAWGDLGMPSEAGSRTISHSGNEQWTTLYDRTFTVARSYGAVQYGWLTMLMDGIAACPGQARVDLNFAVDARPYVKPNAPSGASVSRVSDSQVNIAWTRNPTTAGPYSSQIVYRRTWSLGSGYGAWVNVSGSLAGTATSFQDKSAAANRYYQYAVNAYNSAGGSPDSNYPSVNTTPAAPKSLTATKAGGNVTLTWQHGASFECPTEVWDSPNGGAAVLVATVGTGDAAVTTYTVTAPDPTKTHRYTIRHKAINPTLYSAASNEVVVQLLAPPNPPQITGPSGALDAAGACTLTWLHNPVDSTSQTAYQVRYRETGSSTWTTLAKVVSAASAHGFPGGYFSNGKNYEFQVMTWGEHATGSGWSATSVVVFSAAPTANVTAPVGTITTPSATAAWGYFQGQGRAQAGAEVALYRTDDPDGPVLTGQWSITGPGTSFPLPVVLPDATSWRVDVRVRSVDGLWSTWATAASTVDYPLPAVPQVDVEWLPDSGAAEVTVYNPGEGVAVVRNDVYRIIDGREVLIASGVLPNGTIVDPLPLLSGITSYRVVAFTSLPSSATSAVADLAVDDPGWCYVNFGPGLSEFIRFYGNVQLSGTAGRVRVQRYYAGRPKPVGRAGIARSRSRAVSARLTPDSSSLVEVEAAFQEAGAVACLRTVKGDRVFGSLSDLRHAWQGRVLVGVDFSIEEGDYAE